MVIFFLFQIKHIQIFPITVASRFVTLSWNTSSSSLSRRRGFILQVRRVMPAEKLDRESKEDTILQKGLVKRYEDIDVGLKMNSYTVNNLAPGVEYIFELCLRKDKYVMIISSATLKTKGSGYEIGVGIQTDWVTLLAVSLVLTAIVGTCICLSGIRWWRYHTYVVRVRSKARLEKGQIGDTSSQKEMITSPSDHSSVNCGALGPQALVQTPCESVSKRINDSSSVQLNNQSICEGSTTGDESNLVEHEVASPTEDVSKLRHCLA